VALSLYIFASISRDRHLILQPKVEDKKLSILLKATLCILLKFFHMYKLRSHDHLRNSSKLHFRKSNPKEDNIWKVTGKVLIEVNLREKTALGIEKVLKMGLK